MFFDDFDQEIFSENEKIPGFVIAREELVHIARYWAREELDLRFLWFWSGQSAPGRSAQAVARLNQIHGLLDTATLKRITEELHAEYRQSYPDLWEAFISRDEDLTRAVHGE